MAQGPGKYDYICTLARQWARADGAVVIIIDGEHGSGFSVQGDAELTKRLPDLLEKMAAEIRKDSQHAD